MVAAPLIAEGVDVVQNPDAHVKLAAPITAALAKHTGLPDNPKTCVKASGYTLVAAGAAAGLGLLPRLAGLAAATVLVPATAAGYPFWTVRDDPEARGVMRGEFLRHLALAGAALLLAAGAKKAACKPRQDKHPKGTIAKTAAAH
jgi:uncharacterized membrane protein YphA (DoxX/SURF4 family)